MHYITWNELQQIRNCSRLSLNIHTSIRYRFPFDNHFARYRSDAGRDACGSSCELTVTVVRSFNFQFLRPSTCFETVRSNSGRRFYILLCYSLLYMHRVEMCVHYVSFCIQDCLQIALRKIYRNNREVLVCVCVCDCVCVCVCVLVGWGFEWGLSHSM